MAFIEKHEETLLQPIYDLCSVSTKIGKINIRGDYPLEGNKVDLTDLERNCAIFVPIGSYDFVRGHLNSANSSLSPTILSSDRRLAIRVGDDYVFKVTLGEYLTFASLGNLDKKEKPKSETPKSVIVEENYRVTLSDAAREWRRSIDRKSKEPSRDEVFSKVAEEIGKGCCVVKDVPVARGYSLRDIRDTVRRHVIEGAKKLSQRPGKVIPIREGGMQLNKSAIKQFRESYFSV